MTVKISKNLNRRIQLLKEQQADMLVFYNNSGKIPASMIKDFKQDLKVCKQLLKQELLKAPVNNLL